MSANRITQRLLRQLKALDRYGREGLYAEIEKDYGAGFASAIRAEFDRRNGGNR